ncbi:MAG: hypothetical protein V1743_03235 [Nanoarchaeota archaeon]
MAFDKQWHEKHKMPQNPSMDDRLQWHLEHAEHCDCRKIPEKLLAKILLMKDVLLLKENEKGKIYTTGKFKIIYRYKGTISGDNAENVRETIYFITGSAEVTLKDKTHKIRAPVKVMFPAKTYHKIKALTDICFIMFEK